MTRLSFLLVLSLGCQSAEDRVVLYSAQDQEFAEPLLAGLSKVVGRRVVPKYDTEANKSVSLAAELLAEKARPRCDVHWNNEILNTIRLAKSGIYQPYRSAKAVGFPNWSTAPDGTWQAFATRARVLLVSTTLVPEAERPKRLFDLTDPKWAGKVAIAKPQFGTTATQAACLFEVLGPSRTRQWYRDLKANRVQVVAGNKQAAVTVADGQYAIGLTDTDDAMIEINRGKPVVMIFPDAEPHAEFPRLGTLYIPNTLALVAGAPNARAGQQLIDELLTQEAALATGGGFQIPLHPQVDVKLPVVMRRPEQLSRMQVDYEKAADLWDEVQSFLRDEFAR